MQSADSGNGNPVVVIGAGPAGLTAAYELGKRGRGAVVLESDGVVGGLSRTVVSDGWRFDLGGHRFFTKVPAVEALWREILPGGDFVTRRRMSRIYYEGRFYDYPLKAANVLANLGPLEAARCVASYAWAKVHPPGDLDSFEGWVAARFGRRLYGKFFKDYTEKVWGVPATSIGADWAAQRIRNLSLGRAAVRALLPGLRDRRDVASLIETFEYPRLGPGMMWEACARRITAMGGRILLGSPVERVACEAGRLRSVVYRTRRGHAEIAAPALISSMPLGELARALDPSPPENVLQAAGSLSYRAHLTVALVVPSGAGFPDNWIYVHDPRVKVGRIQNFGSWSPWMVRDGQTCLGMEYFLFEGDDLWRDSDADLVEMAIGELRMIGLAGSADVESGYAVRMAKAYPVYDEAYADAVDSIRDWIERHAAGVHPVGRNGMHRYNNQDHSMLTAMLAVENIVDGTCHDIWSVNVEAEYLEEHRAGGVCCSGATAGANGSSMREAGETGRAAPVVRLRA